MLSTFFYYCAPQCRQITVAFKANAISKFKLAHRFFDTLQNCYLYSTSVAHWGGGRPGVHGGPQRDRKQRNIQFKQWVRVIYKIIFGAKICWLLIAAPIHVRLLGQSSFKHCLGFGNFLFWIKDCMLETCMPLVEVSVTRLGDILDLRQLFKGFCYN